jgi:hypothetical protein
MECVVFPEQQTIDVLDRENKQSEEFEILKN